MSILDENIGQGLGTDGGLRITGEMKRNWTTISKWARFFAIVGFVWIGLLILSLGSISSTVNVLSTFSGDRTIMDIMSMMIPYLTVSSIVIGTVMFFICFFHIRFANQIQRSINFTDQNSFVTAWKNLRDHFRLFGIVVCVFIGIYIITFAAIKFMLFGNFIPFE